MEHGAHSDGIVALLVAGGLAAGVFMVQVRAINRSLECGPGFEFGALWRWLGLAWVLILAAAVYLRIRGRGVPVGYRVTAWVAVGAMMLALLFPTAIAIGGTECG